MWLFSNTHNLSDICLNIIFSHLSYKRIYYSNRACYINEMFGGKIHLDLLKDMMLLLKYLRKTAHLVEKASVDSGDPLALTSDACSDDLSHAESPLLTLSV